MFPQLIQQLLQKVMAQQGNPTSGGYSPIQGTGRTGPFSGGGIRPYGGGYSPTQGTGRLGPFGQGGPRLPWRPQQPQMQALWGQRAWDENPGPQRPQYGALSQPDAGYQQDAGMSWNPQSQQSAAGAIAGQAQPQREVGANGYYTDAASRMAEVLGGQFGSKAPATQQPQPGQQPQAGQVGEREVGANGYYTDAASRMGAVLGGQFGQAQQPQPAAQPEQPVQDNALAAPGQSRQRAVRRMY